MDEDGSTADRLVESVRAPVIMAGQLALAAVSGVSALAVTALLSPSQRGQYALAITIPGVVAVLANGSFFLSVPYSIRQRKAPRRAVWFGARASLACSFSAALALGLLLLFQPAGIFSSATTPLALAGSAVVVLSALFIYFSRTILGLGRTSTFAVLIVVQPVLFALALAVVLLVAEDRSVLVIVAAWLSAAALSLAIVLGLTVKTTRSFPRRGRLERKFLWGFAIKSQLSAILQTSAYRLDVVFVGAFLASSALGVYSIATALAEFAWAPALALSSLLFAQQLKSLDEHRTIRVVRAVLVLALLTSGLAAAFGAVFFGMVLTEYRDALPILILLLPGIVLGSAVIAVTSHVFATGRPLAVLRISGVGAAVGLVFYPLGIIALGTHGAAIASSIVYAAQFLVALAVLSSESPGAWRSVTRVDLGLRDLVDSALQIRRRAGQKVF
jgi:O-antigen/teichoic acid export membrane protein